MFWTLSVSKFSFLAKLTYLWLDVILVETFQGICYHHKITLAYVFEDAETIEGILFDLSYVQKYQNPR